MPMGSIFGIPTLLTNKLKELLSGSRDYIDGSSGLMPLPSRLANLINSLPGIDYLRTSTLLTKLASIGATVFTCSLRLAEFTTPFAVLYALRVLWSMRSIGKVRKSLSSFFIVTFGLWVYPMLISLVLNIACIIGAGVTMCGILYVPFSAFVAGPAGLYGALMGFVVAALLPVGMVCFGLYGLVIMGEEIVEKNRMHAVAAREVQDITFTEFCAALCVGLVSFCTISPVVLALTLMKSPFVFLSTTLWCFWYICKAIHTMWSENHFCGLLACCCGLIGLMMMVPLIALAVLLSCIVKVTTGALWPAYIASGMIRLLTVRRRRRHASYLKHLKDIGWASLKAGYQVIWASDLLTNIAISMNVELGQQAIDEFVEIARGTRQALSPRCRRVSILPPVAIGLLHDRDAWRIDVRRIAQELRIDPSFVEKVWASFFGQMRKHGEQSIQEGLLTLDYLAELPPPALIGLPALVLFETIWRSREDIDESTLRMASGELVSKDQIPRNEFATEMWDLLISGKQALRESELRLEYDRGHICNLRTVMLTGGADVSELPKPFGAKLTQQPELPAELKLIWQSLYAAVYKLALQRQFKHLFSQEVLEPLLNPAEAGPSASTSPKKRRTG